ncbi:MAG: hypothetical protein HKP34_06765 [Nitrosopumilus sp.]|nr:hypothetical protein [Nitrosopumilus sp.]NNL37989.1 hypothetical protein [Nitrosopumilus sp.]
MDFAIMNPASVTAMRDQVLEEEIGRDSIARKTIQARGTLQQSCSFLYGQKRLL